MIEVEARIEGLEEAMRAMRAAFPQDHKAQRTLLNRSLSGAARKAMVPMAKQLALRGDESGALSQSIAMRARSQSNARRRGAVASVVMTPVRSDVAAMVTYVNYYYSSKGWSPPKGVISGGIRHGHLVEFGTVEQSAAPFLYPAVRSGLHLFMSLLANTMKQYTESAVRRAARKSK